MNTFAHLSIKAVSLLPFWALYALSDLLFVIAYYIVGYRKKVVIANLTSSFPAYDSKEIQQVAKGFYRNLCDIIVETIKGYTLSREGFAKRVHIDGMEFLDQAIAEGRSVMALTSHLCNWEWILTGVSCHINVKVIAVYKKVQNEFGEELMKNIRGRFDTELVERKQALRKMISLRKKPHIYGFAADQSPKIQGNAPYFWTEFMNQETVFYRGPAVLAPKLQLEVLYIRMERLKRGYYAITIEKMRKPPYDGSEDESILAEYAQRLEQDLHQQPSNWLWSHKRWKHKRTNP